MWWLLAGDAFATEFYKRKEYVASDNLQNTTVVIQEGCLILMPSNVEQKALSAKGNTILHICRSRNNNALTTITFGLLHFLFPREKPKDGAVTTHTRPTGVPGLPQEEHVTAGTNTWSSTFPVRMNTNGNIIFTLLLFNWWEKQRVP